MGEFNGAGHKFRRFLDFPAHSRTRTTTSTRTILVGSNEFPPYLAARTSLALLTPTRRPVREGLAKSEALAKSDTPSRRHPTTSPHYSPASLALPATTAP